MTIKSQTVCLCGTELRVYLELRVRGGSVQIEYVLVYGGVVVGMRECLSVRAFVSV